MDAAQYGVTHVGFESVQVPMGCVAVLEGFVRVQLRRGIGSECERRRAASGSDLVYGVQHVGFLLYVDLVRRQVRIDGGSGLWRHGLLRGQ